MVVKIFLHLIITGNHDWSHHFFFSHIRILFVRDFNFRNCNESFNIFLGLGLDGIGRDTFYMDMLLKRRDFKVNF